MNDYINLNGEMVLVNLIVNYYSFINKVRETYFRHRVSKL